MPTGDEILLDRLTNRETQLSQQADALDVKASILLVAVTFLAGQSTYLLSKHGTGFIHWDQLLGILLQIVSGLIIAFQLAIKQYSAEASEEYPDWRDQLIAHYSNDSAAVEAEMLRCLVLKSADTAVVARELNDNKVRLLGSAYWVCLISFGCNLAALVNLLFVSWIS